MPSPPGGTAAGDSCAHIAQMRGDAPGANQRDHPKGDKSREEYRLVPGNKAVIYKGSGSVAVETIDYPTLELKDGPGVNPANVGRQIPHGVILKVAASNICGSDQHMV